MRSRRSVPALLTMAVAVGLFGTVLPAQATTKPAAVVNGTCSKGSLSNLQVQREDNGTVSIDFGVDMSVHAGGVSWVVKIMDNKTTVYRGNAATISDGSFSITKVIAPTSSANRVLAMARNAVTGETCKIRAFL